MSHTIFRIKCDQCSALVINSTPCHETGCYNASKPWIKDHEAGLIRPSTIDDEIPSELQDFIDSEDD